MVITLTLAAASLWAASTVLERYGNAPAAAAQGTRAPFAGYATARPSAHVPAMAGTHVAKAVRTGLLSGAARKADDRARPRGRRL